MLPSNFAAFILTNGRPDNVITYDRLRYHGYTGPIYLIIDDLDETRDQYIEKYGDEVIVFDKHASAETFDQGSNFNDMRAISYARNASFGIARNLGLQYFIQLDDDYRDFRYRFDNNNRYRPAFCSNLDRVFAALLDFYKESGAASVAMSQGGDFIGGSKGTHAQQNALLRKCMNSFICSVDRPFQFLGTANEDVNTYTRQASTGLLLLTATQASLDQAQTQTGDGGMTEYYREAGTYIKSFFSVIYHPSSVSVQALQSKFTRLHHRVEWRHTVPKILSQSLKRDP